MVSVLLRRNPEHPEVHGKIESCVGNPLAAFFTERQKIRRKPHRHELFPVDHYPPQRIHGNGSFDRAFFFQKIHGKDLFADQNFLRRNSCGDVHFRTAGNRIAGKNTGHVSVFVRRKNHLFQNFPVLHQFHLNGGPFRKGVSAQSETG